MQLQLVIQPHVLLLIYNVILVIMEWLNAKNAQLINMIMDRFVEIVLL